MAVALEEFVKQLEGTGIVESDTLRDFLPPRGTPRNAQDLAGELVRQQKLTSFQVEEIWQGKISSLVLGNYVLLEKLGGGGMGQVFKARHRLMDRIVAVKLLTHTRTGDQSANARFLREVKAAAKLSHPNIVTALDADCANGVYLLAMELVDGADLSKIVRRMGPLPIPASVGYIIQAARGLEFAHQKGIVHRDVKPSNLILDKSGTVKILDLGLARFEIRDEQAPTDLTSTGTLMGTMDYMAPEQAVNFKEADARADIYSLGCSLHFLLLGKVMYEGATTVSKLLAHRDKAIPYLRATRPEIPEEIEVVFRKLVAKSVDDRYQSMGDVIGDLQRIAASRGWSDDTSCDRTPDTTYFDSSDSSSTEKKLPFGGHAKPVRNMRRNTLSLLLAVAALVPVYFLFQSGIRGRLTAGSPPLANAELSSASGLAPEDHTHLRRTDPGSHQPAPVPNAVADAVPDAPVAVSDATPARTPDELAAAWILENGGTLIIVSDGKELPLLSMSDRPASFVVDRVDLDATSRVTDDSLANLSGLRHIRSLRLRNPAVTDNGILHLRALSSLQDLDLYSTAITDDALKSIAVLANLGSLSIHNTRITDAGLRSIANLNGIASLNIANTGVGDEGLEVLGKWKQLKWLQLVGTQVTDRGLQQLQELDALGELYLANTAVTDAGVAALKSALPKCVVQH